MNADTSRYMELKDRLNVIEREAAKLEERKSVAEENKKKAIDILESLGIDPNNVDAELEEMREELDEQLTEIEDAIGL